MKIAVIMDRVYPYFKGGAEKRMWDIAQQLKDKGYEFHFYTGQWPNMPKNEIKDGIHLHGVYKVKKFYVNGKKSIKESIIYSIKLFPILLRADFDVIDCDQYPLLHIFPVKLISILRNKKLILTWHEVWGKYWFEYIGLAGHVGYLIEKIVTRLPDKIISVSNATTKKLINIIKINPEIIETVPVGMNMERIYEIKPSSNESDVIYVGRLLTHKNVNVLINAIKLIKGNRPDIKCLIIGDGPEKDNLIRMVKDQNLDENIVFTGFFADHDEVISLMKSSKVFVLPSTREGFGMVVVEANACGIPVITIGHKDNASKDLIEEGKNGYICQLDYREIAERIISYV
jgi:glycosyltransferase involved in cell wall biosynthesis